MNKKVKDISAGEEHAALITEDKEVYTWGYGNDGQLGIGNKMPQYYPTKVVGLQSIKKVVCGGGHTAAINENGELYLFGRGRDGQIGRTDIGKNVDVESTVPMKVEFFSKNELIVLDVALGTNHSMVVARHKQ